MVTLEARLLQVPLPFLCFAAQAHLSVRGNQRHNPLNICSFDTKAGPCPVSAATSPAAGNGSMSALLEHFLSLVAQDVGLRRVAQLTAWLEELARDELQEIHGRNVSIWGDAEHTLWRDWVHPR